MLVLQKGAVYKRRPLKIDPLPPLSAPAHPPCGTPKFRKKTEDFCSKTADVRIWRPPSPPIVCTGQTSPSRLRTPFSIPYGNSDKTRRLRWNF